jgi:hypothetical protein
MSKIHLNSWATGVHLHFRRRSRDGGVQFWIEGTMPYRTDAHIMGHALHVKITV